MPVKSPVKTFGSRISSGSLKNKKIELPDSDSAKPTRMRLRQAVFNMLGSRIHLTGSRVVDLCCGSGAWGLEALSRGAVHATLVDLHTKTVRRNVEALGVAAQATVMQTDARTWQPPALFNLVLADPPYASGIVQLLMMRRGFIGKPGSWWVVEVGSDETLDWTGFAETDERTYGVSKLGIGKLT